MKIIKKVKRLNTDNVKLRLSLVQCSFAGLLGNLLRLSPSFNVIISFRN